MTMTAPQPGTLFVVATPIGNLEDLSPRALRVLRECDAVLAEDTRHTRQLLSHFGVECSLLALHEHNEAQQFPALVEQLRGGRSLALVSDAGTPLISDPGFRLVRAARAAGIAVSPIPGPCAAIAALSAAGLPSDRFVFEGFLPNKSAARKERLRALGDEYRTVVLYESSHRIEDCLADCIAVLGGERNAVLARELSKRFETILDGSLTQLQERLQTDPDQRRGEFVLLLEGAAEAVDDAVLQGRRLYALLSQHLPPSQAARVAAEFSGAPRKALYGGQGHAEGADHDDPA